MDRKETVRCLTAASLIIVFLGAGTAGCSRDRPVVVASKNFTEQVILGEIIAQHVEHRTALRVQRKLNLGGTLLAHRALVSGEIDLYPEYTGTALTSILKLSPLGDPQAVLDKVRAEYQARFHVEWLEPLGFNNTFALVIRGEDARKSKIHLLSEAAKRTSGWRLGIGYEFQQRPDGLEGLMKTYALPLRGPAQTMDLGLLYKALEQKKVDMVAGSATDGALSVLDVMVLGDDKLYFPPYQAAIAVREEALTAHPALRPALTELSDKFPDNIMRKLNYQIDGRHRPLGEVATEFLRESGLLP
jgi:osmoprotectant transport system substrate-binding protein